ncbi:hypothetical protein C8R43DRAFT_1135822 [Mycena crocata]|nr:hypothetical protein C8R43DRAFT_1135822 [Mycena crocata]
MRIFRLGATVVALPGNAAHRLWVSRVRTRAQNPREWALAIPPESCPAPSSFSSLATVAMPSACKPVGSGDQPEMQRYCVSRWVPAAGTKGMSAVGRAGTGKFSSVHGPSTEVGPIGLPSVFPRSPPLGSIVIDEAMSTWTSVLCLLLLSLVKALFFLRSITMPTAPIQNFETLHILLLDMGTIWLIGAYIPPQSSQWENWTNVEPLQKLWETVALCTPSEDKHVALLSDINTQIGSLQASALGVEWAKRWAQHSADPDAKKNTRGQAVIDTCNLYKLCILNGTSLETCSPGRFTSWQDAGESVIDHVIVTNGLLPFIRSLDIACPTPDPVDDYADHMRICMTVDLAVFVQTPTNISQERQGQPEFAGSAEVDVLYQATMDAKETEEGALEALWGPVLAESPLPVQIYVEGASAKSKKWDLPALGYSFDRTHH